MKQDLESAPYQKSLVLAGSAPGTRAVRCWLPLLALVAVACSPVDAQQRVEMRPLMQVADANGAAASPEAVSSSSPPAAAAAVVPAAKAGVFSGPSIYAPRPVPAGLPPSPATPARQALLDAREAMTRQQWPALTQAAALASGDPLSMYAQYWVLRGQIGGGRVSGAAAQFLDAYSGTYLADRLRADLIFAAVRSGDFQTARSLGEPQSGGAQLNCARLQALHMTGQRASAAQALETFRPGRTCWRLFDQLVADDVLGWNELLPLLHDAVEADKPADAQQLGQYLFEQDDRKKLAVLLKDPMKWLVRQGKQVVGRNEKALVSIALARLADSDVSVADSYLRREWAGVMAKNEVAWVRSQYAVAAAIRQDSRAAAWFREAGDVRLSSTAQAWRVRSALREPHIDWKWIVASISQMSPEQQATPNWIYWKARGEAALGQTDAAQQAYAGIAGQFSFYGQLAAEELGRPIMPPPQAQPPTSAEMAAARANPGLVRAVQLFRLGWRAEAVPEWNFALRDMSDRQLLAAAELARAEGLYDRVVNTSDRTEHEFDFSQRYIAPFEGRVVAKAQAMSLDPAWVYGLIRQESRFVMDARSYVGAAGLMQLMPATAKWVARKIGMTDFDPSRVHDFDVNTELGTQYLNMVLQNLDGSQVLASAGYNAGPGRPRNWRNTLQQPVEGAIFAETIPFNETRDYVQNVMSNASYYAAIFTGQPQSLKQRLGLIGPVQAMATTGLP
jgi:soluble lytic murein transglycosylase